MSSSKTTHSREPGERDAKGALLTPDSSFILVSLLTQRPTNTHLQLPGSLKLGLWRTITLHSFGAFAWGLEGERDAETIFLTSSGCFPLWRVRSWGCEVSLRHQSGICHRSGWGQAVKEQWGRWLPGSWLTALAEVLELQTSNRDLRGSPSSRACFSNPALIFSSLAPC